jgi:hypothetical protein
VARLLGEGAGDDHEVGGAQQLLDLDEAHARRRGVRVGVGRDHVEPEGRGEDGDLAADVPEADESEHAAGQAGADLREPIPAALADVPVHLGEPVGECEHERDRAGRHRAPDAVGRDRQQHAALGARLDVDGVVADAESGHEQGRRVPGQRGGADVRVEEDDRAVAGHVRGSQLVGVRREQLPVDAGEGVQRAEVVDGPLVRAQDVPGDADAEGLSHCSKSAR